MTPEQPTIGEVMRVLGRLETTIATLGTEIDKLAERLGDKLDMHATDLARHDERIRMLEQIVADGRAESAGHRVQIRAAIVTGVIGLMTGSAGSLLSLFHH